MTTLEQIAPRLAKAHRERIIELRRRRPCGRDGYCCACWLSEQVHLGHIAWMRHEPTPWLYDQDDRRFASSWPYTLVQYHSGFRSRVYNWELRHAITRRRP